MVMDRIGTPRGVLFCGITKCNFKTVLPDTEELAQRLDIHQTWHRFMVMADGLTAGKSSDAEVGGLSFENTTKMYSEFSKLYGVISEAYEKNYDDSGECLELFGEVMCD